MNINLIFGIRFANFVYDVIYHTLIITREQTSKIIASWAKVIITFFTLMIMLDYIKVVNTLIINTILIGFISYAFFSLMISFLIMRKRYSKRNIRKF